MSRSSPPRRARPGSETPGRPATGGLLVWRWTAADLARRQQVLVLALLLLAVASLASLYRFGERENEPLALSDSDYYVDMAAAFAGEKEGFDPVYADPARASSHHYVRPLLPWAAGLLSHHVLAGDTRAAFSALNVAAAWILALLLWAVLARERPDLRYPWLPSVLFLVSFPQVNWGYHILTDTLGYATAFAALVWLDRLLRDIRDDRGEARSFAVGLLVLFALQSLAFLARQTGWISLLGGFVLIASRGTWSVARPRSLAVVAALLAAALPHQWYVHAHGLSGLEIAYRPASWYDPWYVLDFVVKSGVAFHVAWVAVAVRLASLRTRRVPPVLVAWTLVSVLYVAAGYAHNSMQAIGYPLRMTFALFPVVLLFAAEVAERASRDRRAAWLLPAICALYAGISLLGATLDMGQGKMTVLDLLRAL